MYSVIHDCLSYLWENALSQWVIDIGWSRGKLWGIAITAVTRHVFSRPRPGIILVEDQNLECFGWWRSSTRHRGESECHWLAPRCVIVKLILLVLLIMTCRAQLKSIGESTMHCGKRYWMGFPDMSWVSDAIGHIHGYGWQIWSWGQLIGSVSNFLRHMMETHIIDFNSLSATPTTSWGAPPWAVNRTNRVSLTITHHGMLVHTRVVRGSGRVDQRPGSGEDFCNFPWVGLKLFGVYFCRH